MIRINNNHDRGPTGSSPVFNQGGQPRYPYAFFTRTLKIAIVVKTKIKLKNLRRMLSVFNQCGQLRCSYMFFTRTLKTIVSCCGVKKTAIAVEACRFIRTPCNEEMATCKSTTQLPKISPT